MAYHKEKEEDLWERLGNQENVVEKDRKEREEKRFISKERGKGKTLKKEEKSNAEKWRLLEYCTRSLEEGRGNIVG